MTWERAVHKFPRFLGEGGVGACPFFSGTSLCRRGLSVLVRPPGWRCIPYFSALTALLALLCLALAW